jgi:hypothetical protein
MVSTVNTELARPVAEPELAPIRPRHDRDDHEPIPPFPHIEEIPRVRGIAPDAFERDFLQRQRPVIITDAMTRWRALREWTPETFKTRYGDAVIHASLDIPHKSEEGFRYWGSTDRWMPMSEFIDAMRASERPCYVRQAPQDRMPGLSECYDFNDFMDMTGRDPEPALWLGSKGTDSGLHWDFQSNMFAQIHGRKRILLCSPADSAKLTPYRDQIRWSRFDGLAPDFDQFPRARAARPMIATLAPGEVIHIPRGWWHQLHSLDVSISLSCFSNPKVSLSYFVGRAWQAGLGHGAMLIADFVRLGIFKASFEHRVLSDVPTGLFVYNTLLEAISRRLGRANASKRPA